MEARENIDRFGGVTALAHMMGLNRNTVDYWYQENRIPPWRKRDVLETARKFRVAVTKDDLE